jgi:hypothetical protein
MNCPQALLLAILALPTLRSPRLQELPAEDETRPMLAFVDRAAGGTLFGTSSDALYRSTDSGRNWDKLAEQVHLGAVFAFADASGVVVATEGGLSKWEEDEPTLVPVLARGASEKRTAEFFYGSPPPQAVEARKGGLWIATSFDTDGDPVAERMLRSSDTVRVGSHFTALVYGSADDGRSWKEIDRHQGAIVHAVWLGSDDVIRLLMSDRSLRAATLDPATGAPRSPGFANVTAEQTAGGQWANWLAFPSASEGLAGGNVYFGGAVLQRSEDGGRTWQESEAPYRGIVRAFLLGGGAVVRVVGIRRESSTVEVWEAGAFHEVRGFRSAGVKQAHVDATGSLLVRLKHGEVWSLSRDARTWERVGLVPFPSD